MRGEAREFVERWRSPAAWRRRAAAIAPASSAAHREAEKVPVPGRAVQPGRWAPSRRPSIDPNLRQWIVVLHELSAEFDDGLLLRSKIEAHTPAAVFWIRLRDDIGQLSEVRTDVRSHRLRLDAFELLAGDIEYEQAGVLRSGSNARLDEFG